jgi:hypothetical protein
MFFLARWRTRFLGFEACKVNIVLLRSARMGIAFSSLILALNCHFWLLLPFYIIQL